MTHYGMNETRTVALIVAGGSGSRAGGGIPKQYRRLGGTAVIARAFDAFAAHPAIHAVHIVVGAGQEDLLDAALGEERRPATITPGGASRRESVRAGLEAIATIAPTRVLIHDAARPFLPPAVIDRLLAALDGAPGAIPTLPVVDTLVRTDGATLGAPVDREGLARVQTPQAFHFDAILAAHRGWSGLAADRGCSGDAADRGCSGDAEPTDDAQVARGAGLAVVAVPGDPMLEKLTHEADLAAAEARLAPQRITCIGMGYDVHAFAEGDHVWLCGLKIPHTHSLAGHSDADVGLHAITDALLGTIADGDIGSHFPPSDPRWKGADSARFLQHAASLVADAGGIIDHVDLTIICEAPKVGPHRPAMRARIAELLGLPLARVSVKATTTEQLGFTGRREGMAAQAVATVRVPA